MKCVCCQTKKKLYKKKYRENIKDFIMILGLYLSYNLNDKFADVMNQVTVLENMFLQNYGILLWEFSLFPICFKEIA